ncbi:helicase associated domain-containing protein [Streptomyces sp. NPDC058655]|uniref:helicase associated domain-containing protein n=1 Tax=unclassified Streptomyces TaxID=2593676 RepID=UPI003657CE2B
MPIGQHIANLRRRGGLGKDTERARTRAQRLTAIDPDWNCPWPLDWQRHHRILADLVDTGGVLPYIAPGVIFDGDDLGRWLARQARAWAQLSTEQQERLTTLGVTPVQTPVPAPKPDAAGTATGGSGKARQAFEHGVEALAQYVARGRPARSLRGRGPAPAAPGSRVRVSPAAARSRSTTTPAAAAAPGRQAAAEAALPAHRRQAAPARGAGRAR